MSTARGQRGDGKLVRYLKTTNPELNIVERAIKGGWNISEEKRGEVIDELMDMIRSPNRSLAAKAARVLTLAVASDRQHELGILSLLQRDQQDGYLPYSGMIDASSVSHLENADTHDLHRFMESISGIEPPLLESDEEEEEEDD